MTNEAVIVERRDDGSGIVEVPILTASDLELYGKNGTKRTLTVSVADLEQAAQNAASWPGPMPVNRPPHRDYYDGGPAEGFMDKLFVKAKQLWARMDLTASLFAEVAARQWRGFSVDMFPSGLKTPSKSFSGLTVVGGVFTNRPAAPVHFKLEGIFAGAVIGDGGSVYCSLAPHGGRKDPQMDGNDLSVQLATAQAEAVSLKDKQVSLEAKLAEVRDENKSLEARAATAEKAADDARQESLTAKQVAERAKADEKEAESTIASLTQERKDLRAKLAAKESEGKSVRVSTMIRNAVKDGVAPALIASLSTFPDYDKDPLKWLDSAFVSLEAAESAVKALPRGANLSHVKSGRTEDDDALVLPPARAAEMRTLGLDPRFAAARSEADALEIRAQIAREQNATK